MDNIAEKDKYSLAIAALAIEWVDLPMFLFYNFGFLLLFFISGWYDLFVLWISLFLVRRVWNVTFAGKPILIILPFLLLIKRLLFLSNVFLIIYAFYCFWYTLYLKGSVTLLWKIIIYPIVLYSTFLRKKPGYGEVGNKLAQLLRELPKEKISGSIMKLFFTLIK